MNSYEWLGKGQNSNTKLLTDYYELAEIRDSSRLKCYSDHYDYDPYKFRELLAKLSIFEADSELIKIFYHELSKNYRYNYLDYDYASNDKDTLILIETSDLEILTIAIGFLAKHDQPLDIKYLVEVMEDPYARHGLYEKLAEVGKENIIPKPYESQQHFAEAEVMYHSVNCGGDECPPATRSEFICKRTIDEGVTKGNYYFFKIYYDDKEDADFYLRCCGPLPLNEQLHILNCDVSKVEIPVNRDKLEFSIDKFLIDYFNAPDFN